MALELLDHFIADGDFTYPREVEGSPLISTDEITRSKIITRLYAVYNSTYVPLSQNEPDVIFPDSYLVTEQPSSISGPILFFTRTYAQLPNARVEYRAISWTRPGETGTQQSAATGLFIGWNQYGKAAPYTSTVIAEVTFSYGLTPVPPVSYLTQILLGTNPVDFVGGVYRLIGNKTTIVDGSPVTEPQWILDTTTSPAALSFPWVVEVNVQRWRGGIWQYEVVRVLS